MSESLAIGSAASALSHQGLLASLVLAIAMGITMGYMLILIL